MSGIGCFFLDVGRGAANVLLRSMPGKGTGKRAILIDCGPANRLDVLLGTLKDYDVRHIDAIILTHNDGDHCNGLLGVLSAYRGRVHNFAYVSDRHPKNNRALSVAIDALERGWILEKLRRISLDKMPHNPPWFQESWENHFKLRFLSPMKPNGSNSEEDLSPATPHDSSKGSDLENEDEASLPATPHDASAVVSVRVGQERLIFSGDANFRTWNLINALHGKVIQCAISTVPHHGGLLGRIPHHTTELRHLFREIVRPRSAIISVGSVNNYGHPREDTLEILATSEVDVLCTEITPRCWTGPLKEIPGAAINGWGGVCCAGTIEASIPWDAPTVIHNLDKHSRLKTAIQESHMGKRMCH